MTKSMVGDKIKSLRITAKMNQGELARAARVSPAAISLIESGERTPSIESCIKIARALRVSSEEITAVSSKTPSEVDQKARAFFIEFGFIASLDSMDREIILGLAKQLSRKKERRGE